MKKLMNEIKATYLLRQQLYQVTFNYQLLQYFQFCNDMWVKT
jgi:hypothetical protein